MKLTTFARSTLEDRYMVEADGCAEDVFTRSVKAFSKGKHRQRMLEYVDKQWFIPSTPVLANGGTTRGNPIACFLNRVNDSREGITDHYTETSWLASNGGGVGAYWGGLRSMGQKTSAGSQSNGMQPFLGVVDRLVLAFAQGGTRRASYSAVLDASHPEIYSFVEIRKPTGGDINRKCLNLHHGVNFTDEFMLAVKHDLDWDLVDPHTKQVIQVVKARYIWEHALDMRNLTGEPYCIFVDNMNNQRPQILKDLDVPVYSTNLCTEITVATQMPDNSDATGVCCLGSINAVFYDSYKDDRLFVKDCLRFLDNVLQSFIDGPSKGDENAKKSAEFYRDVGLGVVGWHSLCQLKGFPLDSVMAASLNTSLFGWLRFEADIANRELGDQLGACKAAESAGQTLRFTHMLAVAPNASTSIFVDTSAGIEPYVANAYIRKTASGTVIEKNPQLKVILDNLGKDTEEVWTSIAIHLGSVQHLDFLDDFTKEVYKTAHEYNQLYLVELAASRGKFIDQGQSLNLFFVPGTSRKYFQKVHFRAWELGLKTLYYVRGLTAHKASTGTKVTAIKQDTDDVECLGCAN